MAPKPWLISDLGERSWSLEQWSQMGCPAPLSVCLSLCFCTCSVALCSLPHSLPTLAAVTRDLHYSSSKCSFIMHGQLSLFATPNMEMPCKTQPWLVELSCKLFFSHRKTLPFVSHILIRMAFHYPDGIITSALTQCCFPSPFPTCSDFSTCWLRNFFEGVAGSSPSVILHFWLFCSTSS